MAYLSRYHIETSYIPNSKVLPKMMKTIIPERSILVLIIESLDNAYDKLSLTTIKNVSKTLDLTLAKLGKL